MTLPDVPSVIWTDLDYQGNGDTIRVPIKTPAGRRLTDDEKASNAIHAQLRSPAERAKAMLKTTYKVRRWVAAAQRTSGRSSPRPS